MNAPQRVVIATRESPLALWQAEHVQALLRQQGAAVDLLGMTTRGDQILDRTLSKVGGKGLFVKELEVALLEGRADLAVHSLKDVPMELPPEFELAAVMTREDPRDCVVSTRYATLEAMPAGARIGTSSLRRELMLRARFPRLSIQSIRGNVGTRLAKLDRGEFDALVMAAAGLKRLGLADRIRQIIPTTVSLPAPGQGALGIEVLRAHPTCAVAARATGRSVDARGDRRRARRVARLGRQLPGAAGGLRRSRRQRPAPACVGRQRRHRRVRGDRDPRADRPRSDRGEAVARLKADGALRLLGTA